MPKPKLPRPVKLIFRPKRKEYTIDVFVDQSGIKCKKATSKRRHRSAISVIELPLLNIELEFNYYRTMASFLCKTYSNYPEFLQNLCDFYD